MSKKRGNGEGSIYYSETLKRWVGQFTAGRKTDGTINRKSVYGKTRKEVAEKINKSNVDIKEEKFVDKNDITIVYILKEIINNKYNLNKISDRTYIRSMETVKIIEKSDLNLIPIQKITEYNLTNFLATLTNYSNSIIDKVYSYLVLAYNKASVSQLLYNNLFSDKNLILKPKSLKKDKNITALTIEEQKLFLNEVKKSEHKNVFLLAIYTGMRIGEILALQKNDIDLKNNLVHISRTLTKDKQDKVIIGDTTKTYAGIRDIPIRIIVKDVLNDVLDNYTDNQYNLLFITKNSDICTPCSFNSIFKEICKNAHIRESIYPLKRKDKIINLKTSNVNTHMLRHTYATRCIEAGISPVVLQKLLGHKDISTTLNTYTSVFNEFKIDELNKVDLYMNKIGLH
ncbi:MAG: site-specific integrase [Clostridia bacterium]